MVDTQYLIFAGRAGLVLHQPLSFIFLDASSRTI